MLAGTAEKADAAGQAYELRHPIARRHERVKPFQAGNSWRRQFTRSLGNCPYMLLQRGQELRATVRNT
jgi:hypothetical protein